MKKFCVATYWIIFHPPKHWWQDEKQSHGIGQSIVEAENKETAEAMACCSALKFRRQESPDARIVLAQFKSTEINP